MDVTHDQVRRPPSLGMAIASLVWPAGRPRLREAEQVVSWQRKRFLTIDPAEPGGYARPAMHRPGDPRSHPKDVAGKSFLGIARIQSELRKLGIDVAKSTVEKYRVHPRRPPSPTWRAFLANHTKELVSLEFFTVATVRFQVLFVLILLAHDRRRVVHFNISKHPTARYLMSGISSESSTTTSSTTTAGAATSP